jgi:hypothetical protein
MNAQQNFAFNQLVRAWNRREAARLTGDIRSLSDARTDLDHKRVEMRASLSGMR